MKYCIRCGVGIQDWDSGYYARGMKCINCYNRDLRDSLKERCSYCGRKVRPEEGEKIKKRFYCKKCAAEEKKRMKRNTCRVCEKEIKKWEKKHRTPDGNFVCDKCYKKGPGRSGMKVHRAAGKRSKKKEGTEFFMEHRRGEEEEKENKDSVIGWIKKLIS